MMVRALVCGFLALSVLLLGLDVWGDFDSARQGAARKPAIPQGQPNWRAGSLWRQRHESDAAYFYRLTRSVHFRMTHTAAPYRVPADENWALWALGAVHPSFSNYDYADYRRGLDRGAGLCTQFAAVVFDILRRQGFRRQIIELRRHAFVQAWTASGRPYLLDADFGAVVPASYRAVQLTPALAVPAYRSLDPTTTPLPHDTRGQVVADVERAFASPVVFRSNFHATPQRAAFEPVAYAIKWLVPILLICIVIAFVAGRRFMSARAEAPASGAAVDGAAA
jgi:hypothetical protein